MNAHTQIDTIVIREAGEADIPVIVAMGRRFFEASPWPAFTTYDVAAVTGVFGRMIAAQEAAILVAEKDEVVGCIGLIVTPIFFAPASPVCNELFWWVNPEHRGCGLRLAEAGEKWARDAGAKVLAMSAIVAMGGDRIAEMYERRGMVRAETTYIKGLF